MQHPFSGSELKNSGMLLASQHADLVIDNWSSNAYALLKKYIKTHIGNFMCEHVRKFAKENLLPEAPTSRSWGSVIQKAAKDGLIIKVGYAQVTNPKAHMANAAVWSATTQGLNA